MSKGYTIYACGVNVDNLEAKENSMFVDDEFDPDPEDYGYAMYNEDGWGNVYAESLVSAADARRIVLEKCRYFAFKFAAAAKIMEEMTVADGKAS